jgi:hypothetical protein
MLAGRGQAAPVRCRDGVPSRGIMGRVDKCHNSAVEDKMKQRADMGPTGDEMTDTPGSGAVFRGTASRAFPGLVKRGGCGQLSTVTLTPELNLLPAELKARIPE